MGFRKSFSQACLGAASTGALIMALAAATPAAAQSDTATLQGHVDNAAPGTPVVATDTFTGQRQTGVVDGKGDYLILGLRPSTYRVDIAGREPREATLFVGQTGVVDFVEKTELTVTAHRSRTLREVRTQTISTNITPAQIETLPQNQRNFLSFAALAPGVALTAPSGATQLQAGATSSSNTNVLLDGMSLKNPINHGGVFGQNFGLGNPFPESAIQEYKVDTQNFGAETGQTGSALITAITKTGGDHYHGSVFLEYQPNAFIEQPFFDQQNHVPKPAYGREQFGGEFGGPIIKDKLTFYFAGEGTIENLPAATTSAPGAPPAILNAIAGTHSKDFKQGLYFGKLTYYATDRDTINLEAFIRRENNLSDIDSNAAGSHGRTILTHEERFQLNWRHRAGDFVNNFNMAYDHSTQSTPSVGTGPEQIVSAAQDFSTLAELGANSFNQADATKSYTIKDDATLHRGDNTFTFGGQIAFLDLSRTVNDHFNGTYFYSAASGTVDLTSPYGARINIEPTPTLDAKDTQLGFYVQDEWKPDAHWTINAGLRWDFETNANNNNYVTPAAIVTALQNYQGWKAVGINPADYISTGSNRKPEYDEFQPRLGVSYDVHGDRNLVFFGGLGRYYDRSLFIEGVIETLTNSNNIQTLLLPACAGAVKPTYCSDPNALRAYATTQAAGGGGSVWLLNNKTHMPYSDQVDVGVRKRFGQIQTSLTFSYIRSHNIFQFVRANYFTNGWYTRFLQRDGAGNVIGCTNGGNAWIQDNISNVTYPNCPAGGGQLPGFNGKLDIGASGGVADYKALYLTAEKPFTDSSKWGFTTALTIQWARSNDAQELNSDEFYNGTAQNVYGWSYVNGSEKWRWVTTGNYRAPYGVVASGTLILSSGPAFGNIVAPFNSTIVAPDGACCYGNLGGVFFPRPIVGYRRIDLRLAKTFRMPYAHSHELTVDFQAFNIFNWLNRTYSSWGSGGGRPAPLIENGQVGNDSRSFQAGIRYKF